MRNPSIAAAALLACSFAAASQILTASRVSAADYPVLRGSQIEDTPPPPSSDYFSERFSWTGFYVGGFAAQSQTRFETDQGVDELVRQAYRGTTIAGSFNPVDLVASQPRRDSGTSFGVYTGYNFAFGDAVLGLEGDYSRVDQSTTASTFQARRIGNEFISIASRQDAKLNDMLSFRARFGYAFGKIMPYFSIGAAVGRFDTNVAVSADWGPTNAAGVGLGSYVGFPRVFGGPKKDVWGYGGVVGGGVEAALADNIILRVEYLYTRFNDVEGITVGVNTARVGAALKF
jgi:opacity protein-like surface antigen